ncbi:MAG: hypothetical protein M1819_003510 [Sarea resinae]|nr:MAG: hypothetical protein M1819_003510 [Sarea resinae]
MSEGEAEPFSDDEYDEDRPNTADSSPPSFGVSESKTGIVWKYANQGSNLLRLSVEESSSISVLDDRNAAFGRQLYLHALTYLLRGLPTDLSVEEQSTLQRAVPLCVFKSIKSGNSDQQLAVPSAQSKDRFDQPSLIHRILASIIVQLFILFQCILPYLKLLARSVYSYDRDHQVSERLVAAGADTMDKVSKRSLELGTAVLQMGDGKVGQTLNELAIWWLEGVAGGICQGIGEGMIILGNGKQNVPPRQAR